MRHLLIIPTTIALTSLLLVSCDKSQRIDDRAPSTPPIANPLVTEMCPDTTQMNVNAEKTCSQIGCYSELQIILPDALKKTPGAYRVAIKSRGEEASCEFNYPVTSCDERPACSDEKKLITGVSGCAMSASDQEIGDLQLSDLPPEVELTIERDGEVVLEKKLTPEYTSSQPNGDGCEPRCCQAREEL